MSKDGEERTDIVEIDAIGAEEWERDQHTPQAIESNLAALVKQSATSNSGPVRAKQLDDGWDDANGEAAKPRTTTNTLRRTGTAATVAVDRKTKALGTPITRPAVAPAVVAKKKSTAATGGWVAKPRAASPSVDPTFAPFAPPFAAPAQSCTPTPPPMAALAKPPVEPAKPRTPTPPPMAALAVEPAKSRAPTPPPMAALTKPSAESAKPRTPTPQPMAAVEPAKSPMAAKPSPAPQPESAKPPMAAPAKPRTPTPQPMAALAKPQAEPAKPRTPTPQPMATLAKSRAPTPPPMLAISRSEPTQVLTPSAPSDFVAEPTRALSQDWAEPTKTGVRMPPETVLPSTSPTKPRAPTPPPMATVKAALALPVWPPPSEPDMLPPPPVAGFEDWENPNASTSIGNRVEPRGESASDFKPEDSVIIDLNAVPRDGGAPRRPQTYPVIQTSEQSTTTSGVFTMPTAAAPKAVEAPAHTPAPTMPEPAIATSPFQRPSAAWHTPMPQTLPGQPTAAPPLPSFPSAAGLLDDLAVPAPLKVEKSEPKLARRTLLATVFPTPQRRRTVLLVAGGALGLVIVLVVALSGGSHASPAVATAAPATPHTTASSSSTAPAPAHAATAATHVAIAAPDTVPDKLAAPAQPTKKPAATRRNFRAKKPVIVDYDKKQDPTPSQDEALARARAAYATGNQHLFAGETDAAIASYHQALTDYPSYVAGYRGLGLAYAQQGNRTAALTAFKTYVGLAPNAKDVALIEKRISRLSIAAR